MGELNLYHQAPLSAETIASLILLILMPPFLPCPPCYKGMMTSNTQNLSSLNKFSCLLIAIRKEANIPLCLMHIELFVFFTFLLLVVL